MRAFLVLVVLTFVSQYARSAQATTLATSWAKILGKIQALLVPDGGMASEKRLSKDSLAVISEEYLYAFMPDSDRESINASFIQNTVGLALEAKAAHPWADEVPLDIFLNEVLPCAVLNEPRDDWRPFFRSRVSSLVKDASTITEAAQILNREIWKIWNIVFKADQAPEILSPMQVIHAGYGSCSALSIFLVAACRSVGIPARVAGTADWVDDRRQGERFNNHNWVEIWDQGAWSFTGAAEYDPQGMNRTWFYPNPVGGQQPGSRRHGVFASSYRVTRDGWFPLAWNWKDHSVPGVEVTQHYLSHTPSL